MDRSDPMENKFRGQAAGGYELIMFQTAFLAETDRTYITAPITFYAFLEFIQPPVESVFLAEFFKLFNLHVTVYATLLFKCTGDFRLKI
jgi:hypothetical protein